MSVIESECGECGVRGGDESEARLPHHREPEVSMRLDLIITGIMQMSGDESVIVSV